MTITISNTTKVVELNGIPARIWEGETANGVKVHAFITRIAVDKEEDLSQFEAELAEQRRPSADIEAYPLRLIL